MTVAELIAELQRAPQDALVIVDTDQGQTEIKRIRIGHPWKGSAWLILDCDPDGDATS
jgi:hypothetical protein